MDRAMRTCQGRFAGCNKRPIGGMLVAGKLCVGGRRGYRESLHLPLGVAVNRKLL